MAVVSDILPGRRLMSLGNVRQAGTRLLDRLFVPREVILRAGGRVSYFRLTSRIQQVAAGVLGLSIAWGLFATASYVGHSDTLASKDREIASHKLAYREVETDLDRALEERARLEAEIAGLSLSLGREIEIGGRMRQHRAALERRVAGLQQRLADLREAHRNVIVRFRDLAVLRADAIENTIADTGLDADRLISSIARSNFGRGGPLIPIREASDGLEGNTGLADVLADLNEQWDRLTALQDVRRRLPLAAPLAQFWISSAFGARKDPFTGERSFHAGVDLVAPMGSGIRATAPGLVVFAGQRKRYGRMIEIDHGHGITTRYAHLGKVLVRSGQPVERGQTIATLGNSGRSTGPHLHYEVLSRDRTLDPVRFLEAGDRAFEG